MKDTLSIKLVDYLRENNPDILFSLQQEGSLATYVNGKLSSVSALIAQLQNQQQPEYIIEEVCMEALTEDLGPSKYHYIKALLEEEFINDYQHLLRLGILRFEIINMISVCASLFEAFEFNETNEGDKNLRYTITGTIQEYFELSEKENRAPWPITPIINL